MRTMIRNAHSLQMHGGNAKVQKANKGGGSASVTRTAVTPSQSEATSTRTQEETEKGMQGKWGCW